MTEKHWRSNQGQESDEMGTASRLRQLCGVGEVSRRRAGRWRVGGGVPVTGGLCAGWHTVVHSMGSSNRCCGEESMLVHKGVSKGNIYEP
jgi:hypothetical protein